MGAWFAVCARCLYFTLAHQPTTPSLPALPASQAHHSRVVTKTTVPRNPLQSLSVGAGLPYIAERDCAASPAPQLPRALSLSLASPGRAMTVTRPLSARALGLAAGILLIATVVAAGDAAATSLFDTIDANHDGSIDKAEYTTGLQKLQAFLQQPLLPGVTPPATSSSFFSFFTTNHQHEMEAVFHLQGFWKAFTSSLAMIIATEIGDKTFFIAAVLSMKHSRSAVFTGAILALVIMTILSTAMGLVLPNLMPRKYTHILGGLLFLYFGVKLVWESRQMETGRVSDELEEVEEELLHQSSKKEDEEVGRVTGNKAPSASGGAAVGGWYAVAVQALTLTFLAEWGDRSQIATIALAAAKNPVGVTVGGCLGHALCTGMAVVGGRMLASRISEKTVTFCGGCIFILFGLHSLFWEV
jgi:putative Ca2+/H+ antiporter (TMEM165/GDT1 family)